MPDISWTPEQGQTLLQKNAITPEQFARAYPDFQPVSTAAPLDALQPQPQQTISAPIQPLPPTDAAPAPKPMGQAEMLGNAYASNFSPETTVTSTAGLGDRDKVMTEGYANAYGMPVTDQAPPSSVQQPPIVGRAGGNVGQNAGYNPDGLGLIEPAVPGGNSPQTKGPSAYDTMMTEYMKPIEDQKNAINELGRIEEARSAEESAAIKQSSKDVQKQMADNLKMDTERRKYFDTEFSKLQTAESDLAGKKVDPDRFWANKSTGQKVLAGIALILGGFGAAKTGENNAVKVITDAINKDVDQQRWDIGAAKDQLVQKRGILGDMMGLFKDERIARDAAVLQGIQLTKMNIEAMAARSRGAEGRQRAAIAVAQLDEKGIELKEKIKKNVLRNATLVAMQSGASFDPGMMDPEDRKLAVGLPGKRFYGIAYDDTTARKIREKVGEVETGREALDKLISIAEKSRGQKLSPELNAQVQTLLGMVKGKLKTQLVGPGAVSDGEWKRIDQVIADPSKIFSLGNEGLKLREIKTSVDNSWRYELNAAGLTLPEDAALSSLGGRVIK